MSILIKEYRLSFLGALSIHLFLLFCLLVESHVISPVLVSANEKERGLLTAQTRIKTEDIVHASSIDQETVQKTIERLKLEKKTREIKEIAHQQALKKEAEMARLQRVKEQQRLQKLQDEAKKLKIIQQQEVARQKKNLEALAHQKTETLKQLDALKQAEKKAIKKQEEIMQQKAAEEKRRALLEKERQDAENARKIAEESARQEKMAGEVDKYKAMILQAISRQWILPEYVNQNLSSRFRIRLASDGKVLEATLLSSSGDPVLDRSAETAIYKASPLPVPSDPHLFNLFREISLTVRPENIRG